MPFKRPLIFSKAVFLDLLAVAGVILLGYGLFLFLPWVGYAVSGFLVFLYVLYRTKQIQKIDVRDAMFFGGLIGLGYGLYLKEPWIAFAVCGFCLMAASYLMRDET